MHATPSRRRVVIIGGGITGLTACYRLQREAQARGLPLEVTLVEASQRLGGVIATSRHQGLLLEHGPDCFLVSKPWGIQLCEELQLSDQLISPTAQHRQSFIVRRGTLVPVPQGFYLMIPGSLWSFAVSPILSWRGKLRMALDLVLPRRTSEADESLAQFVTRRLGREALERIAQPMVGGIYTADPIRLSLQATMPQFLDMERRHGSLIRAMRHNQRVARRRQDAPQGTSGPRYGLFVSFKQGMQTLVDRLAAGLPSPTVRLQARVRALQRQTQSSGWLVHVQDQPALEAEALCLALPAPQAAQLLADTDATLAAALRDIPYASSATVNAVFKRQDVAHPLHGMGFVVPVIEQRTLMACSFSSVKFAGRAPKDSILLRAFVGGALQQAQYGLADEVMQRAVYDDLRQLLGVTGPPVSMHLSRHPHSMPQYHLGHVQRITHIETLAGRIPGLVLAGNAYHGIGIPDCIHSGDIAAQTMLSYLGLRTED
ncbi:Protoporphyrinogen oxidase [Candidatus Entotheonellaceae bacterium PAL068K]